MTGGSSTSGGGFASNAYICKTIALQLALSVATVNRHVANIYEKIGVNSRAAATAYALRHSIGKD